MAGVAGVPGQMLPPAPSTDLAARGANWAASGVAGVVNQAVTLRARLTDGGPGRRTLAAMPGALGLVGPALQTAAGAALLLGAAVVRRR